ncbi:MAG: sigma-70 family RNA polymerase sigma factor [Planctomycetes bacterium]|nr:sigma-70 family RNA polymerase sigma factor [Planctomycetota bacterium]
MTRRADDTEDVEQLLVAFAPRVYGLLLRMVGRPDVAEDLVQETALRVVRRLDTYRPEGKFQAWIFCIAVNLARDWMRRQPRTPASLPSDTDDGSPGPVSAVDAPPDAPALARERRLRVEAALARLSETDRAVLLMRYYGEMAFKDIARATDEPLGTVLARAHRALKKLGDLIPEESP